MNKTLIKYFLFIFLSPIFLSAQDFDEAFLESLPDGVKEDLLQQNMNKRELEQTQYKRPSSFILKPEGSTSDRFGSKIFSMMQTTLMPLNEPNFDGSYILDFGDVLELQLVGQKSSIAKLPIKRDGSINIPEVGKIFVSGLSLNRAIDTIINKVNNSFIGVDAFVTLVNVRDIQVIVAGNVYNPGPYTLNGNSNLFHALSVSGGPSEDGSFRLIDLIRNDEIIETVDLYQTFIFGKSSFKTRLRSGDLIFVQPVQNLVSISGGVKREGIYELKADENLSLTVFFANGVSSSADLSDITLYRILNGEILPTYISNLEELKDIESKDSDKLIIRNYPFRSVVINGAVKNPGKYIVNESDGIYGLVKSAGGYSATAYPFGGILENQSTRKVNELASIKLYKSFLDNLTSYASNPTVNQDVSILATIMEEIKNSAPSGRVSAEFDLLKLEKDRSSDVLLQDGDVITIPEFLNQIYIFGEVLSEGTSQYIDGNSLYYYIKSKGGFNDYANKKRVFVIHPNGETFIANTNRNIFMKDSDKVTLYPGSIIYIPRDNIKVPYSIAAQAYASILGNIGLSLASVSVLKD